MTYMVELVFFTVQAYPSYSLSLSPPLLPRLAFHVFLSQLMRGGGVGGKHNLTRTYTHTHTHTLTYTHLFMLSSTKTFLECSFKSVVAVVVLFMLKHNNKKVWICDLLLLLLLLSVSVISVV